MIDINGMSIIERLRTMEDIWDSLISDENNLSSPNWHEDVLSKRKLKIESGNAEFISLHQLKEKHRSC